MIRQSKSILFRTDANAIIGLGHFYRSLALAQMLASDFEITFAIADPLPQIKNILQQKGFELISLAALDYTNPDARGYLEFDCDLHGILEHTNIVVTDGYWFREKYRAGLRKENVKIAVIEDDGGGEYDADLIINHAPGLGKTNYSAPPDAKFALGLEYALLRPEFIQAAKYNTDAKRDKKQVFICFGGADIDGLAIKMSMAVLENTTYLVNLIISANHPLISKATKLKTDSPDRIDIRSNLSAEEMVTAMSNAAIGIVPASGLVYECIACNLPTITGYYADNQKNIYSGIQNHGAIIPAGDFNRFDLMTIDLSANYVAIQKNQAQLIDGNSGERMRIIFKDLSNA